MKNHPKLFSNITSLFVQPFKKTSKNNWLVVSTHLKKILVKIQNGNLPQIGVKIKHTWNHHPDNGLLRLLNGWLQKIWWGLSLSPDPAINGDRGGEKLAREKQNQVKEFVAKAVDEVSKQLNQGASLHHLAEYYGVREGHQIQALPPFKGRATSIGYSSSCGCIDPAMPFLAAIVLGAT